MEADLSLTPQFLQVKALRPLFQMTLPDESVRECASVRCHRQRPPGVGSDMPCLIALNETSQ
jgi:hypothetical protein